jgi:hypothetical protein
MQSLAERTWKTSVASRENNISKLTFHRWRRQFGELDAHEACRLIERERNKIEIENRVAEWTLKNRLLSCLCNASSHLPV